MDIIVWKNDFDMILMCVLVDRLGGMGPRPGCILDPASCTNWPSQDHVSQAQKQVCSPSWWHQPSYGTGSPNEQAPSTLSTDELSMALIESLSSEDAINQLNRDSIDYDRIINEVTKRIKLIVDPLLNNLKEKDLEI